MSFDHAYQRFVALSKGAVREHTRTTKSGKTVTVRAHERGNRKAAAPTEPTLAHAHEMLGQVEDHLRAHGHDAHADKVARVRKGLGRTPKAPEPELTDERAEELAQHHESIAADHEVHDDPGHRDAARTHRHIARKLRGRARMRDRGYEEADLYSAKAYRKDAKEADRASAVAHAGVAATGDEQFSRVMGAKPQRGSE